MCVSDATLAYLDSHEHTSYCLHGAGGWTSAYGNGSHADLFEHLDQKSACG